MPGIRRDSSGFPGDVACTARGAGRCHRGAARLLVTSLACLLAACGSTDVAGACTPAVDTVRNAFNSYADSGEPIANISLEQVYTSYPAACHRAGDGAIRLLLTSTAPVPLAYTYQLRGFDGNGVNVWSFDGEVRRIAPGEAQDGGIVARSSTRVDVKATVLFGDVTVLQ